jgi:hypothetical protein
LNRLNIDETSGAFKRKFTYLIPLDILGNTRSTPPDLGAYQNKSFLNKERYDSELNSKSVSFIKKSKINSILPQI